MIAVFKREFKAFFNNTAGFVFVAVYLLFCGMLTSAYNLLTLSPSWEYVLADMTLVLALLAPVVTVSPLLEERRSGGGLLLLLPLDTYEIVLGKYLALLGLFAVSASVSALFPMLLGFFGGINYISAYGALLGFLLFGAALMSVCMFISTLTENPAVCAVVSYVTLVALYALNIITVLLPSGSVLAEVLRYISLFGGFDKFIYGIFDLKAILYYLATVALLVFLAARRVDRKRFG